MKHTQKKTKTARKKLQKTQPVSTIHKIITSRLQEAYKSALGK